MLATVPGNTSPGYAATVIWAGWFRSTCPIRASSTWRMISVSFETSVTIGLFVPTVAPALTSRCETTPLNGARMIDSAWLTRAASSDAAACSTCAAAIWMSSVGRTLARLQRRLGLVDRRLGSPHVVRIRVDQPGQVCRRLIHDFLSVADVPLGRIARGVRA